MAKRNLLKLPDDLEANLRALLHTPPPPHDIPGSRKAAPKVEKPKRKRRKPRPPKVAGTYAYEAVPVKGTRKRTTKKR